MDWSTKCANTMTESDVCLASPNMSGWKKVCSTDFVPCANIQNMKMQRLQTMMRWDGWKHDHINQGALRPAHAWGTEVSGCEAGGRVNHWELSNWKHPRVNTSVNTHGRHILETHIRARQLVTPSCKHWRGGRASHWKPQTNNLKRPEIPIQ